jgi:hypothetical protein
MRYRLAKLSDYKSIANLHYNVRTNYRVGIFAMLGKTFLKVYYSIVLNDPNEIVVCAEEKNGKILGFCSATLDVKKQFDNLRKHRIALAFAALGSIIRNPSLIKPLIGRYKSTRENNERKFITAEGPRSEYWAWSASNKDSVSSLEMHEVLLNILRDLGVGYLNFEVDTNNKKIFLFHKYNGAQVVENMILPDGRERVLMRYDLKNRISKLRNLL